MVLFSRRAQRSEEETPVLVARRRIMLMRNDLRKARQAKSKQDPVPAAEVAELDAQIRTCNACLETLEEAVASYQLSRVKPKKRDTLFDEFS